ncbi:ferredoxin [Pseudonocardia sp.]|uniref:ferredoxin n=1 Tax=Pseudonocardia sp. TaxID=60912 RepID=UPI0039C98BF0
MIGIEVSVDRDSCVGAGQCVLSAPAVFDQDEDGLVELTNPRPPAEQERAVSAAARLCPARVISLG